MGKGEKSFHSFFFPGIEKHSLFWPAQRELLTRLKFLFTLIFFPSPGMYILRFSAAKCKRYINFCWKQIPFFTFERISHHLFSLLYVSLFSLNRHCKINLASFPPKSTKKLPFSEWCFFLSTYFSVLFSSILFRYVWAYNSFARSFFLCCTTQFWHVYSNISCRRA